MRVWTLSAVCLGAMACGSLALGQQSGAPGEQNLQQERQNRRAQQTRTQDQSQDRDRQNRTGNEQIEILEGDSATAPQRRQARGNTQELAAWLALGNQAEVELGKLAMERTQNDDVRKFAQQMVEDHNKALNDLRKFMPQVSIENPDETPTGIEGAAQDRDNPAQPRDNAATPGANRQAPDAANQNRSAADRNRRAEDQTRTVDRANRRNQRQATSGEHGQLLQIGIKASKYKLQLTKQVLQEHEGQDFDMGYLGQQIVAHIDMLATLHAMQDHGSPDFQQTVRDNIQTTESHLKHARALALRLEDREYEQEGQQGRDAQSRDQQRNNQQPNRTTPGGAQQGNNQTQPQANPNR